MDSQTGTKPVADQHRIDEAALTSYLGRHLAGFTGPLQLEQFKGGQSNPTFKLITPQRSYVMRTKPGPAAKLLPSAHAIEREFRVMRALRSTDVPVPEMHLLCEDESVIGRAFYLMEFIEGRVLWDQSLPGFDPGARAALYDEMNRVMAALHTVDIHAAGLDGYGKPGNYFERQIGRWSKQYIASITEPIPAMGALMAWLPAHMPASAKDERQVSIVHGDYRLDNLVFPPLNPESWRCLTGSCQRSATRLPTSATTACPGTSRPALSAASADSIWPPWAFRTKPTTCSATANAPAGPCPETTSTR